MSDAKVAIAGPGRAGTELLLEVLTDLGLHTGLERGRPVIEQLRSRPIVRLESPKAPRIVYEPGLARRLGTILDVQGAEVEHVIVPVRALDVAAASRLRASAYGARLRRLDPPTRPSRATGQRDALGVVLYELLHTIARFDLPHTLLVFPRFAYDARYLAEHLGFLDPAIPEDRWRDALTRHADPARIDEQRLTRRERVLLLVGATTDAALVKPARAVRRAVGDVRAPWRGPVAAAGPGPAGTRAGRPTGSTDGDPDVTIHVASINTAPATELCLRTMRHYAGHPFRLVVGDCGSTDGSIEMLRRFESRGWLTLEVAPEGRMHAEWLDTWMRTCPTRYAVFCDSDIEFYEPGWLADMVGEAVANEAALVCAQMIPPRARFVHPHTGAKRTLGPRPAPWLLLVDAERVRGRVDAGFGYLDVVDPTAYGGKVGYDVGGAFFAALRDAGLGWVEMPDAFRAKYRHFSGLSWRRVLDWRAPLRVRPGQLPRLAAVYAHLGRARLLRYGEQPSLRST